MKRANMERRSGRDALIDVAKSLQERYGIQDSDIGKPGFYSFDPVTGRSPLDIFRGRKRA